MTDLKPVARQALALMDLTSLNDDDDSARIQALCRRADTPAGHPAALCLYPAFIEDAQRELDAIGLTRRVRIATVTNFPDGAPNAERAARETRLAVAAGADEVEEEPAAAALLSCGVVAGAAFCSSREMRGGMPPASLTAS